MLKRMLNPFALLAAVLLAALGYSVWWFQSLAVFKAEMALLTKPGGPVEITARGMAFSGFPYRHEVNFETATLQRNRADYRIVIHARDVRLTRTAWSRGFLIGEMDHPVMQLTVPQLQARMGETRATADAAAFSIRSQKGVVERISLTFENFAGQLPWSGLPVTAGHLEFHGRERRLTPADRLALPDPDPRLPTLLDVVVSGKSVALAGGLFGLDSSWEITGVSRGDAAGVGTLEQWRTGGGTLELKDLTLKRGADVDTTAQATVTVDGRNHISAAGTLATACLARARTVLAVPLVPAGPTAGSARCGSVLRNASFQIQDGTSRMMQQ